MNIYYAASGILLLVIALAHSVLGEKLLISRLYQIDIPEVFGSQMFAKRILRFAWHLTTIIWWACGALLIYWASLENSEVIIVSSRILATAFLISSGISLVLLKGRHWISWVGFLLIGILAIVGSF